MSYEVLIFSHSITPRLQYIVDFISQYYKQSFKLTSDEERFVASKDPCKINYSYHRLSPEEIFIHSHVLLFETSLHPVKIVCSEIRDHKIFFKTEGDAGFDIFAAIFYLLTRYEEYLPYQKDYYGRFAHESSVAFKENFLHLPLINIWLEDFRKLLAEKNASFKKNASKFSFLPTYDIDMAWSFRNKGFKRNAGGFLLSLLKAKFRKAFFRIRVLRKKTSDPFDAYEWMDALHEKYQLHPIYFFLVAKEKGRHDKNIDPANPALQALIKNISAKYKIALHPSWASGDQPALIAKEKQTLEKVSEKPVHESRQHFIRFELPAGYQRLLASGITADYSMGYGSINGFRASIASPFYWYDLKNDRATELLVRPFCFMDANAFYEQHFTPQQALEELLRFYQLIKAVEGDMITIWHNSFLGNGEEFAGWREMYEAFVEIVNNQ